MSTVKEIEQAISGLSPGDLASLREWFAEFDWAAWDRQLDEDLSAGRLDSLAEEALRDLREGRTTEI